MGLHKCAIVIGCADGVWEEVAEAQRLYDIDLYIAVNNAGVVFPVVDHWVSFHVDLFDHWRGLRANAGFPPVKAFWSSNYRGSATNPKATKFPVQRIYCNGGSSGLIGAMVAIHLAEKAVLAGIPMDPERAHYDKPGEWGEALKHREAWLKYLPQLKGRVISMSGWTKELLKE